MSSPSPPSVWSQIFGCHCLGDTLCGTDVDELFVYQTPKVVKIKDRTLGLTKMALLLSIFIYILVFQVAYNGEHFRVEDIEGVFRLQWQQPTKGWCNPMDVECDDNIASPKTLPYCKQYTGNEEAKFQATCSVKDAWELPINLPAGVLMPTYVEKYAQRRNCVHDDPDCTNKYKFSTNLTKDAALQSHEGEADPLRANFIAAVEDFTVLIDHSFSTTSGSMAFDDFHMQGYFNDCSLGEDDCVKKPITCVHDKCDTYPLKLLQEEKTLALPSPGNHSGNLRNKHARPADSFLDASEGSEAAELSAAEGEAAAGPKVISLKDGDVLSLKTMLQLAAPSSSSQKHPRGGYSLEDVVSQSSGATRRMRGSALVIRITYDNFAHWRIFTVKSPPEYTLSVRMRPAREFKNLHITQQLPEAREFEKAYGILVVVQQVGKIRTFSIMNALIVVTAALGLLAVSSVLTDFLALYLMPRSETYTELKYQESEDLVTVAGAQQKMEDTSSAAAAASS